MEINLSAKQFDYLRGSTHSFNISSGSVSSGKTFVQVLRWIEYIYKECPDGCLLMMSGKTGESLYDNVIRDLVKFSDGDISYGKQPPRCYVHSKKIEIACASADNERSWGRIQGKTVHGWLADEIVQHPETFVRMAQSRCRGEGKPSPKFWTCNPDSPSHFIKTGFIDNPKIDVRNWFFSFEDNPMLGRDYVNELKNSYTGIYYDRFILGKWVLAEGVIYDKFLRSIHVVNDYPRKAVKEYIIGIDWGYATDHPMALVLMAVTDKAYYVIDEVYLEKQLIDSTLMDILGGRGWFNIPLLYYNGLNYSEMFVKPSYAYCDSARPDYIDQFQKLSGVVSLPAFKQVDEGIQAVQRRFIKTGDGSYGLYIMDKCINTIRELELYRWDKKMSGLGKDTPIKVDDHTCDAIRYAIFTRDRGRVRQIQDMRRM